jgi:hypothetical protein
MVDTRPAPVTTSSPVRGPRLWPYAAVPAIAAVAVSWLVGINFDVRYVFGGLRVAAGTGTFESIFVHRPLAFRALIAMLDIGPHVLTPHNLSGPAAETIVHGEALVLAALVCLLLWAGVRRYRAPLAAPAACAVWVVLALAGPWSLLEPDWAGAMWSVGAVGAALAPRRPWLGGALAGVFVVLAVASKMSTGVFAVLALVAVWLFDRRRGWVSAGWSAGLGAVWLAGTAVFEPTEWQWLRDMADLAPGTPFHTPLSRVDWSGFLHSAANLLVVSPVVLVIPAAGVLIVAATRRRWVALAGVVVAVLLVSASVVAQAEWYQYQWIGLPVLAVALAVLGVAVGPRVAVPVLVAPLAVGGVASAVLLSQPVAWRAAHFSSVVLAYVVVAVGGGVLALVAVRRPDRSWRVGPTAIVATLALTIAVLAANLPDAGYSYADYHAGDTNLSEFRQTAALRGDFAALRQQIGATTPVLYLAFGDIPYLAGLPTSCRFPSAVWLQRSTYLPYVRGFATYQQNAACLTTTDARYLILEPSWINAQSLAPPLAARVDDTFDCTRALSVDGGYVLACPRR